MDAGEARRLVLSYADLIARVAYTYLRSATDAEDVCQEVLMRRMACDKTFESPVHERAWVVRVTINLCKNLLRDTAREHVGGSGEEPDWNALPDDSLPAVDELAGLGEKPDRAALVLVAVQELGVAYREAVFLRYYEGYSVREVAKTLGISEDAAAQRLSRARTVLKKRLKGVYDEQDI